MNTPFEIQTRDKSGRWRKTAGQPRVHTFGLARLRAGKLVREWRITSNDTIRVRNTHTGDVWPV